MRCLLQTPDCDFTPADGVHRSHSSQHTASRSELPASWKDLTCSLQAGVLPCGCASGLLGRLAGLQDPDFSQAPQISFSSRSLLGVVLQQSDFCARSTSQQYHIHLLRMPPAHRRSRREVIACSLKL